MEDIIINHERGQFTLDQIENHIPSFINAFLSEGLTELTVEALINKIKEQQEELKIIANQRDYLLKDQKVKFGVIKEQKEVLKEIIDIFHIYKIGINTPKAYFEPFDKAEELLKQ